MCVLVLSYGHIHFTGGGHADKRSIDDNVCLRTSLVALEPQSFKGREPHVLTRFQNKTFSENELKSVVLVCCFMLMKYI